MEKRTIKKVVARRIYDSRANPTIEVEIIQEAGSLAVFVYLRRTGLDEF